MTTKLFAFSSLVSSGGENSFEAVTGICGILSVQCSAAHKSHHLCGQQERYRRLKTPQADEKVLTYHYVFLSSGLARCSIDLGVFWCIVTTLLTF